MKLLLALGRSMVTALPIFTLVDERVGVVALGIVLSVTVVLAVIEL